MAVTSYNGWVASRHPRAIGINQEWEPIPGHRFPGGIKSGDVETVMTYLVRQLDKRVEPIELYKAGDEWGWYFKPSANSPSSISCHSSGTAVDYNATRHPNGRRGTFRAAQVAEIRKILREVGVIRWGGDFPRTPDEMHFEIKGTVAQVAIAASRIHLLGNRPKPPPPPKPPAPNPPGDEMFTYECFHPADGKTNVLVLVASGKQVRITDNGVLSKRRSAEDHLGLVGNDERDRFKTAFGSVIGI